MIFFFFFYYTLGIQRPLKDINELSNSIYIPKGVNIPALDRKHKWEFIPSLDVKVNHVLNVLG
jgi:vacuolar-type H+-ATPase catalytic subunit A/Vma1